MKMKKFNKIFLPAIIIITTLFTYSCDPFDDIYLTLAMELQFDTSGNSSEIFLPASICLSDFEDYDDNQDKLDEILYISSMYLTLNATTGLQGDNLRLTFYQADHSTVLFQYIQSHFVAGEYISNPLEIILTEQEKVKVNNYLKNPQVDKCFYATLEISNVSSASQNYILNSKMQFLTQLKVKP
jgi:hypothetical protein